jgi:hypothetical protein
MKLIGPNNFKKVYDAIAPYTVKIKANFHSKLRGNAKGTKKAKKGYHYWIVDENQRKEIVVSCRNILLGRLLVNISHDIPATNVAIKKTI